MKRADLKQARAALLLAIVLLGCDPPRLAASPGMAAPGAPARPPAGAPVSPNVAAPEWPPITPAERELVARPGQPRSAVILFEEGMADDRDPGGRAQTIHRRLKILTREGLSRSEVTVTLAEPEQAILELAGRTIGPDGRETRLAADSITRTIRPDGLTEIRFRLPDARIGGIIEYRYRLKGGSPPPMGGWVFQHEIPCLRSTFLWRPGLERTSRWTLLNAEGFTPAVEPITLPSAPESLSAVRFEMRDLPALVEEPFGPPAIEARPRLLTTYTDYPSSADDYWNAFAVSGAAAQEGFISRRERVRAELLGTGEPPADFDARVRLAYDFAQRAVRTEAVGGAAADLPGGNADSLLAAGAADPEGRNLLFIAALATLDINATRAFIVDRDRAFFHRDLQTPAQFTRTIVAVTPGTGRVFFFSPATPFAPPGMLPWYAQGVTALLAGGNGAIFATTPVDPPAVNRITRAAGLALDAAGNISGRVKVDLAGQPEMVARLRLAAGGSEALRSDLEMEWGRNLAGIGIDSLEALHQNSPDRNLSLAVRLRLTEAGQRVDNQILLNMAVFGRESRNPFAASARNGPVYFPWARITSDNVALSLPKEWRLETVPDAVEFENALGAYRATWSYDGERLVYQRNFMIGTPLVRVEDYALLRELFERAAQGDAVLVPLVRVLLPPSKR